MELYCGNSAVNSPVRPAKIIYYTNEVFSKQKNQTKYLESKCSRKTRIPLLRTNQFRRHSLSMHAYICPASGASKCIPLDPQRPRGDWGALSGLASRPRLFQIQSAICGLVHYKWAYNGALRLTGVAH